MTFRAFKQSGYTYCRSSSLKNHPGVKVMTFAHPQSAAVFAACDYHRSGAGALVARDDERGDVPILDKDGKLAPGALAYLATLLSNDEQRLLGLFGVDLQTIIRDKQ